jgi:hypothetical protein
MTSVAALAALRNRADVEVIADGDHLWLRWSDDEEVLSAVLPLPGVELYERRAGEWYHPGQRLPCIGPPGGRETLRLDRVVVPAPLKPLEPPGCPASPVRLLLVGDGRARPATALGCTLAALAAWADGVPRADIEALRAARKRERVLVRGVKLPLIPNGERFWGQRVLVPLGQRPEPALPESALAEALGLQPGEIAVLRPESVELVPGDSFEPLTRAGIRLATGERMS